MVMLERLRGYAFPKADDERTSSHRTEDAVAARLRKSGYPDLANIRFDFHEGVLVLRGRLPTYYLKQVAQTVVADVDGVQQIDNRIEVFSAPTRLPR